MSTNLRTLVTAYRALAGARRAMVLATVVETLGSTYRKAGARMIITEDGEFHGIIGGGCFEGDLLERARGVFATGETTLLFYDMRAPADELWGLGLGCNGAVRLLLERVDPAREFGPLPMLARCLARRDRGVLATICASNHAKYPIGRSMFFAPTPRTSVDFIERGARRTQQSQTPSLVELEPEPITVFYDWVAPPPHVLVIGAGPDAVPVVKLARMMDWEVSVVDHREAYADPKRLMLADRVLTAAPESLCERAPMHTVDAAILMTHNIGYDERFLRVLGQTAIPYIGLLGPAERRERLLDRVGATATSLKGRVFGPVGLDIGAKLPEEIAVAIIAELVAHFRSRSGRIARAGRPAIKTTAAT